MKASKRSHFKLSQIAASVAFALASPLASNLAHAGAGWGNNNNITGTPIKVQTYYANSPSGVRPNVDPAGGSATVDTGTALRKFVDTLPMLGEAKANNLGQYIPEAVPEKWVNGNGDATNDDYYEIAVVEYTEKMHSDLAKATRLRGYVQLSTATNPGKHIALNYPDSTPILDNKGAQVYAYDNPHYLGPLINATKGVAVRIKYSNYLPVGAAGNLFLPVDTTLPGAGVGPDGVTMYTQNRADIHWHGGDTPWISDGTPHQWIAPAGEIAAYAADMGEGASAQNVPDMPDPGPGSNTLYFPNNMTGRMMWFHDHTSGLTRLNVYAGVAAGYILKDPVEQGLVASGAIPNDQIPLIIQDKTFVPKDIAQQDAKWDTSHWGQEGDLWFPHVYETNQDPNAFDGTNPVGRWDWGPWFWPVFPAQYSLPSGNYGDVTTTPEAFMDTPLINGTAYPTVTVDPKAYRFRILNASNDRFVNLGVYQADMSVISPTGVAGTEMKMVPASADINGVPLAGYPATWPTDGRSGGVPDPTTAGPDIIQIGNEGGLLPKPAVIPSQPISYEQNRRSVTVLNIQDHGLLMGPAERADVVIDFSKYAGQTLILYNDSPAPVPAFDPRIDYFTGDGDQTGAGGAGNTLPGYGPNTRTMMQIKVSAATPAPAFNVAALDTALPAAYGTSQDKPVIPESVYNTAFNTNDQDNLARIFTGSISQPTFDWTPTTAAPQILQSIKLIGGGTGYLSAPTVVINNTVNGISAVDLSPAGILAGNRSAAAVATIDPISHFVTGVTITDPGAGYTAAPMVTFIPTNGGIGASAMVITNVTKSLPVQSKAIQELFDPVYGRMNATLGVELPYTSALIQTTIPLAYIDPATETIADGETQIWKITHNGVDTHPVHFHLVNVQVINRIGWDGTVKPADANEMGWKETVRMNPLEDIVVAVRAKRPIAPFGLPQSVRMMDPSQPLGSILGFTQVDPMTNNPMTVANALVNYDNEYVWHCHILGHEENDFMRPLIFHPVVNKPDAPTNLNDFNNDGRLTWIDPTPAGGVDAAGITTLGNVKNEIGFKVYRAVNGWPFSQVGNVRANITSWQDPAANPPLGSTYSYQVVAYNASGDSALSNIAYVKTAPAAPSNLAAPVVSDSMVALTWKDNSGNELNYQVWRNGVMIANLPANTQSFVDSAVTELTAYSYEVIAVNNLGTATTGQLLVTTPVAVAAPTALTAVPNAAGTQVTLRWTDNANNETAYLVEMSTGGAFTTVTTIARTAAQTAATGGAVTYNAVTVPGSVYTYRVTAQKVVGLATKSSSVITAVADLSAPAAPTTPSGLTARLVSATQVALTWVDNATTENAYVVEASTNGGAFTQLAAINRTAAQRTATGGNVNYNATVVAGNTYTFQVKAQATQYGLTTPSAYDVPVNVSVTAPIAPTNVAAVAGGVAGSVVVNWADVSNNESGFTVQRSLLTGAVWGAYANVGTVAANVTTISDTGRITGRSYRYQVRANGVVGNSVYVGPSNTVVAP